LYYVYKNETIPSDENVAFQTFILWWYRGISVIFGRISIDSNYQQRFTSWFGLWWSELAVAGAIRNDRRWFSTKMASNSSKKVPMFRRGMK
jgi:hypothetical protein